MSPLRFTVLCKTKACNLWPESKSDRQEVKTLSEEERGEKRITREGFEPGLPNQTEEHPAYPAIASRTGTDGTLSPAGVSLR